jgi:hypothetical protein
MRVGANLREAEYVAKNGELHVGIEIGHLCAVKDVPSLKPMPLKKLKGAKPAPNRTPMGISASYGGRPPQADDDLPF